MMEESHCVFCKDKSSFAGLLQHADKGKKLVERN